MPWATASAPHPLPGAVSWLPRGPPPAQALNPPAIIKQTLTWAAAARDARPGHRGNAGATAQPPLRPPFTSAPSPPAFPRPPPPPPLPLHPPKARNVADPVALPPAAAAGAVAGRRRVAPVPLRLQVGPGLEDAKTTPGWQDGSGGAGPQCGVAGWGPAEGLLSRKSKGSFPIEVFGQESTFGSSFILSLLRLLILRL